MFNPLKIRYPKMGTLANSEDPDEMLHNGAFHQGLYCLLRQNPSFIYIIFFVKFLENYNL